MKEYELEMTIIGPAKAEAVAIQSQPHSAQPIHPRKTEFSSGGVPTISVEAILLGLLLLVAIVLRVKG